MDPSVNSWAIKGSSAVVTCRVMIEDEEEDGAEDPVEISKFGEILYLLGPTCMFDRFWALCY